MKKKDKEEKQEAPLGKINVAEARKLINKAAGYQVAYDLENDESPTEVKEWISSGNQLIDLIVARGQKGGIPVGKIVEIAGLEACVTEDTEIEIVVE